MKRNRTTYSDFRTRLVGGEYKTAAGAHRTIAMAVWSAGVKTSARESVEAYFDRRVDHTIPEAPTATGPGFVSGAHIIDQPSAVKRVPVNYLWSKLNWDFLKLLAEIAQYAEEKYGSAEQYTNGRLTDQASPVNHMYEHLRQFQAGELHDHFGTHEHQLAAVAYGAMMEFFYLKAFGFVGNPVMQVRRS